MRYTHVALHVDDLRAAEAFYRQVFDADVLFREAHDGVWRTLPPDAGWEDAERAGTELHMVALGRDGIVLPLFAGTPTRRIIGIEASLDELESMRRRLPEDARLIGETAQTLVFSDPFDVEWQVRAGGGFQSSGELHGRWLVV